MARLVLSSTGTWGDFLPFIALGKRLQARGHHVRLAVNPTVVRTALEAGLDAVPCGRPYGEAERRAEAAEPWDPHGAAALHQLWDTMDVPGNYRDLFAACRDADLLIGSWLQQAAPLVHERLGVPWVTVVLQAAPIEATQPGPEWQGFVDDFRKRLGLPAIPQGQDWSRELILVASSPHFSESHYTSFPQARVTGFWFPDELAVDWQPDPTLATFLRSGSAPLLLTFGSMVVPRASEVVAMHLEAARITGRRLLIQRGWSNLESGPAAPSVDPGTCLFIDYAPHSWLFPRVAAVIHHGGIGTLALALRCGCPVLVEPLAYDQVFNARRVLALRVGMSVYPHLLTADRLARSLEERVLTPKTREHARRLAALLQQEDGLATACDLIEHRL
jgi:UDP:flavonoid glycosyltransferase YjiC (YdhE family)